MYVLRKSYGAYSAGTVVDVSFEDNGAIWGAFIGDLDIPSDLLVKRRNMTRYGPAINSRERRRRERQVKKALGIDVS